MSRINLRVREQLFSSLLRQDLSFFQEIKTGEAWVQVWDSPGHSLSPLPSHLHPFAGAQSSLLGQGRDEACTPLCKRGGVFVSGDGQEGVLGTLQCYGFLMCSVLLRGVELTAELGYHPDEPLASFQCQHNLAERGESDRALWLHAERVTSTHLPLHARYAPPNSH